eukprot:CAMPEP_0116020240 /NCGR_PEP_ID=MMETSP0321-20121206/9685_1 /TAXON_ID=163516 /ORGANISM="Leptocylindrus danicus var. danicus, Strain B650" /LENGTH=140 /DNA_ID=CAMNT_0003490905 /DNA_START=298 /DNA_END=722 /DNA_ORIENTATION=-
MAPSMDPSICRIQGDPFSSWCTLCADDGAFDFTSGADMIKGTRHKPTYDSYYTTTYNKLQARKTNIIEQIAIPFKISITINDGNDNNCCYKEESRVPYAKPPRLFQKPVDCGVYAYDSSAELDFCGEVDGTTRHMWRNNG